MSRRAIMVSAAFALAIALGSAALRGGVGAASPAEGYRIWSDAFFVASSAVKCMR